MLRLMRAHCRRRHHHSAVEGTHSDRAQSSSSSSSAGCCPCHAFDKANAALPRAFLIHFMLSQSGCARSVPPPAGAACKKERTKAEPRVTRSPVGHTNPPAQPSLPSSPESRAAPPSSRQPRADAPTSPTASSSSRPTAGRSEPSTSDAQSTASCPAVPQQARHTDLLNLL